MGGIADRIIEAFQKLQQKDFEGALIPISIALDATAKREYGKGGRASYKDFIKSNMRLITRSGCGPSIGNIQISFSHPEIKNPRPDGTCTMDEILYHIVRCSLLHEAELGPGLRFEEGNSLFMDGQTQVLPSCLINGLLISVVAAPVNTGERVGDQYGLLLRGYHAPLNLLWGKRDQITDLLEAIVALEK